MFLPGAALPYSLQPSVRAVDFLLGSDHKRAADLRAGRERTARLGAKCTHLVEKERGNVQFFEVSVNLENDSWRDRLHLSCQKLRYPKKSCVPFSLFKN